MRGGSVVRIRLSPKECMNVIDLLEQDGLSLSRIGISNAASIAFSKLLSKERKEGKLPVRSGYEFLSMMSKLDQSGNTKEKKAISDALYAQALRGDTEELTSENVTSVISKGARWVDAIFLPQEYDSWDDIKQWHWRTAQYALRDAGQDVMMSAEGWQPPSQ